MTNPQCIHIPDGSVVVSGELFDLACAAIGERDKLFAEIAQLRGNLSLAEDGLASATQELQRVYGLVNHWSGVAREKDLEIERLSKLLDRQIEIAADLDKQITELVLRRRTPEPEKPT